MDETKLKQIEERAAAASAGPWKYDDYGDMIFGPHVDDGERIADIRGHGYLQGILKLDSDGIAKQLEANGHFIVASREDVPALVAEVRALNLQLSEAEKALSRIWHNAEHYKNCWSGNGCVESCPVRIATEALAEKRNDEEVQCAAEGCAVCLKCGHHYRFADGGSCPFCRSK